MPAKTTAANGVWSAAGTWTGGIPAGAGDTCTINHNVEIDQNIQIGDDTATASINVAVGKRLFVPSTVAASYTLTSRGTISVSGTFEIGTAVNPIPAGRVFTLQLNDSAALATGKYGMNILAGGTFTCQGVPMAFDRSLMSVNGVVGDNHIHTADNTAWVANDVIVIASTTRTAAEVEPKVLSGAAVGDNVPITVNLANAHSGTAPTQAEVANYTRNVKITTIDLTKTSFVHCATTAVISIAWTEFNGIGTGSANKHGLEVDTTTGSLVVNRCSFRGGDAYHVYLNGATCDNATISNCVFGNFRSGGIACLEIFNMTSGPNILWTGNLFIGITATQAVYVGEYGITCTYQTITSCTTSNSAMLFYAADHTHVGVYDHLTFHSNSKSAIRLNDNPGADLWGQTLSYVTAWRNADAALLIEGSASMTSSVLSNWNCLGNSVGNIRVAQDNLNLFFGMMVKVRIVDSTFAGEAAYATPYGYVIAQDCTGEVIWENCDFGAAVGGGAAHTTADFGFVDGSENYITLRDCSTVTVQGSPPHGKSFLRAQLYNHTAGNHFRINYPQGSMTSEAVRVVSGMSQKLQPALATMKLQSSIARLPVAQLGTGKVQVQVYLSTVAGEGANYGGAAPNLIVLRNPGAGILTDTILDTHSGALGVWETLVGETAAVTVDSVLEFVIDCDTSGYVFVDDWIAIKGAPGGLDGSERFGFAGVPASGLAPTNYGNVGYWLDGEPILWLWMPAGGGVNRWVGRFPATMPLLNRFSGGL